jgi:hypothetical protein
MKSVPIPPRKYLEVPSTPISQNDIYNIVPAVKHPARPTMSQLAVHETVDEARELTGREVEPPLPVLTVGSEETVPPEPVFVFEVPLVLVLVLVTTPPRLGTMFWGALAQFAWYMARDLVAVGLTAMFIPD